MGGLKRKAQEVSAPKRSRGRTRPPAACTIIARNYLPYAKILAKSYRRHEPNAAFYLLVVDRLGDEDAGPEITVIQPEELNLPYFFELCFKYDVTELSTAVKPTLLRLLLEQHGEEQVIFFDPDILITRPLVELKSALRRSSIVLTPHLLKPLPADNLKPSEQDILRDGIFNLGFVAVRNTPVTDRFLRWWEARLRNGCRVDRSGGLFTDQKWVDLVPAMFPDATILLDPTYNVAYWNLATRSLSKKNGRFLVDGRPLAFFHFSGFSPAEPTVLSKHENRTAVKPGSALGEILALYARMHGKHAPSNVTPADYGYSRFKNGVPIHSIMRQLYFDLGETEQARFSDPFEIVGPGSFFDWATHPHNGSTLSPFLEKVYSLRYDVAAAYPDARGKDREAFIHWAATSGPREMGYDLRLAAVGQTPNDSSPPVAFGRKIRPFGLNIVGYFRNESGLGFSTRAHVRAIQSLGIPVALRDVSELSVNRSEDGSFTTFHDDSPYDLNLICINADQHFNVAGHLGEAAFDGRYNIGVWWWELPRFPEQWRDRFAQYDEIWAGSAFVASALSEASPIPIVRIPPVMTGPYTSSREAGRRKLKVAPNEFVFLFVFDFHSYFQRKNPLAAIAAFRKAFKPDAPVRLVIKCTNSRTAVVEMAAMQAAAAGYPIDIHDGYWPAQDMRDLTAACDAYVSLHRSEGFGQTIAEAMALGKPAIATAWSGNVDFMTAANSYLVNYQLTQLTADFGPYRKGQTWAEPSVEHAAQLMREAVNHPAEARRRGARAQRDIEANFSEAAVAEIIKQRLGAIAALRQSAAAPVSAAIQKPKHVRYREMTGRIREMASEHIPAGAIVAVISRGDDALLRLDGRTGWHFPQTGNGVYAGYHPKESATAIAHLQALVAKGATHLLLPETAFWWLEHYRELQGFLDAHCRLVARKEDTCVIYELTKISAAESETRRTMQTGVNVVGHFRSEKGVGEGARSDVRALQAAGVPIVLNDAPDSGSQNSISPPIAFSAENPHPINLVHFNPDQLPQFAARVGENYFRGKYNIGFWAWELSRMPAEWVGGFERFQEIWVPSSFTLDAIAMESPVPVEKMPHCLPAKMPLASWTRAKIGLDRNAFVFLFIFDFHSSLDRKNPMGLIRAFKSAFKRSDKAVLVLKTSHSSPADIAGLKREAGRPNIRIVDQVMDRAGVNRMIDLCDCYVSLHRSEGFGLTMAEAMALGKPVIATGYSGNLDFMTNANSFLVDFTLTRVARDLGSYRKGGQWADPKLDHAASLMRQVYRDRDAARAVGLRAKRDVRRELNPTTIGARMRQRLESIRLPGPAAPILAAVEEYTGDAEGAKQAQYWQLVERIRGAISAHAPEGSKVAVISRGDSDLLNLGNLKAGHFFADSKGGYLGYHPPDGAAAVARLESLRASGTEYLLIPQTAFWWLTNYPEFREHLAACYPLAANTDDFLLYKLGGEKKPSAEKDRLRLDLALRILSPLQESERLADRRVARLEESTASYATGRQLAELAERVAAQDAVIAAQADEIKRLSSAKTELAEAVGGIVQEQQRLIEHSADQKGRIENLEAAGAELASTVGDVARRQDANLEEFVAAKAELSQAVRGLIEQNQTLVEHVAAGEARADGHEAKLERLGAADATAQDQLFHLGGLVESVKAEIDNRLNRLEQAIGDEMERIGRQRLESSSHLAAQGAKIEQLTAIAAAAENKLAEVHVRIDIARAEIENRVNNLERLAEEAIGHMARQGSDTSSHLAKHDSHLGALDSSLAELVNLVSAGAAAGNERAGAQDASIEEIRSRIDAARTEIENRLTGLEQATESAVGHMTRQGLDTSSHLAKHDEHLSAVDISFEKLAILVSAGNDKGGEQDARIEQIVAAVAVVENQFSQLHARIDAARAEIENRLKNLEQATEGAVEHMTRQGSDTAAHLAKHDAHLGGLDASVQILSNLFEARDRAAGEFSRLVSGKLGELGELPGAVGARIEGLESRLQRIAATSDSWLGELTKWTTDLTERINRRQPAGKSNGNAEVQR